MVDKCSKLSSLLPMKPREGWALDESGHYMQPVKRRRKRAMPAISEKWKKELAELSALEKPRTLKVALLNPFITCPVCQGYLVDATTITECLHSFCRSCIVKHFEHFKTNYPCPLCHEVVHKTNPWYNLKTDSVLQDVVGKLVPGFLEAEERRRKIFYKSRGLKVPEKVIKPDVQRRDRCNLEAISKATPSPLSETLAAQLSTPSPPLSQETSRICSQSSAHFTSNDEDSSQITMQLEMKSMDEWTHEDIMPLKRKFVRCSSEVTVGLLQKFLAKKLKLEAANQIEIICNDMELGTDFTLHFIQETIADEKDHTKPLLLYYGLSDLA